MAMTLVNADTYISRILGGSGDTSIKAQAREALQSAYEELLHRNNWTHLQVDTTRTFTVADCNEASAKRLVTSTTNGFKNVLVGMTVTGTGVPADTTVAVVTDTTTLTLTEQVTDITDETLTFGGTIPIISGTDEYALPVPFYKPISCRFTSARYVKIKFLTLEEWDAITGDQTNTGTVSHYTIYRGGRTFDAGDGLQQDYIRFIRPPGAADVCQFRYYRLPDFSGTYVDVPDEYLFVFLDLAQIHLLLKKDATSRRIPALRSTLEFRIARAISTDRNPGGDDQIESFLTANQHDAMGSFDGNIWPKNYLGRG